MKKLFPFVFAAILCSINFTAFSKIPAINSSSNFSIEERIVKNFNGVAAGGPIHVVIKFGDKESLRFEGDAEAIATLISEVKGDILIIRPENSWKSWSKKYENKQITAYITAKRISSLTMSGNGSINVTGSITGSELAATLSGSGSIKASVNVKDLTGVISGSGSLRFNGKANEANVTISGSGSFNGPTLTVNDLSTQISGSGSVNITAERKIEAVISGSGHVNYSGDATVEKTVIGSGSVKKI